MKLAHQAIRSLLLSTLLLGTASAQLVPPAQDYYLHTLQRAEFCCGDANRLTSGNHDLAWLEATGAPIVSNALTVEAWVYWEDSDLEEIQAATGLDMDQMTLFCGQQAYGFQYRSDELNEPDGWTFFIQSDNNYHTDTGIIPLPRKQWAHLAATYDGVNVRTFLNGVQQDQVPLSGIILNPGSAFPNKCSHTFSEGPPSDVFGIGLGKGFTGGIRQLRIWNRAVSEAEILANASLQLDGTESGLVGYWPLDGPPDPLQAPNKVAGGASLTFGYDPNPGPGIALGKRAEWRSIEPMFVVREDLAEDVFATDCPSIGVGVPFELVDVQDDGDLDLIFSGSTGDCGAYVVPFRALIHDGANGFVFDTSAAFTGTIPFAHSSYQTVTADFNGDGRLDIFSGNLGEDYCTAVGSPNTLLLSRPDGRLEDASGNLLGPPCNADSPQYAGQHMCFAGGSDLGRTPGMRYPGTGEAVMPDPDYSHGVSAGDIDGDGDVDIVVGNVPNLNLEQPYLLLNDGQGGFSANWQLLPDYLFGPIDGGEDDPAQPLAILLDDLDGDGHVDVVTAPAARAFTDVWAGGVSWNDGSGDFSAATRLVIVPTPGIPPHAGAIVPDAATTPLTADIDNDGDKDLLVMWNPEVNFGDHIAPLQILVNHGSRVFVDETVARIGTPPQVGMPWSRPNKFYASDMNSDGCLDLLFPYDLEFQQHAGIWFNDCQGNFTPLAAPGIPKAFGSYIPLDFDRDGDTDLINAIVDTVGYAGMAGCSPGEGGNVDYMDFAVLLNQSPPDTDVDGVSDIHDLFPSDPDEWFDADSDGIGDNADLDDDNDSLPDIWETANGLNLRDATDATLDGDGDTLTSIDEFLAGTDPRKADTDGDGEQDNVDSFPTVFFAPSEQLLRRSTDNRWFVYAVSFEDNTNVVIEQKGFASLTRNPAYQTVSRSDFDGDGTADLLVRDMVGSENGRWVMYTLDGPQTTSSGFVNLTRNADWQVAASDDFDRDGKADLLLRNTVDGRWLLYLLDSQTVKSQGILAMSTDLTDVMIGTGDFDGDGRFDVLLRKADGSWLMYPLHGNVPPTEGTPAMTTNLAFTVQSLADFNGDGNTDVLLRRNDGRWFMYELDGAEILAGGSPAMTENTAFSLVSDSDFNNDGKADAMLRRDDGRWFLYSLDGATILNAGNLNMTRNPSFQIVSTDDFTGDGKADALLRRGDGRWVLYGLDGNVPIIVGQSAPNMTRNEAWIPQTH